MADVFLIPAIAVMAITIVGMFVVSVIMTIRAIIVADGLALIVSIALVALTLTPVLLAASAIASASQQEVVADE